MTAVLPAPRAWQLVERAQAGDSDAMAAIYRANYDTVYRFVRARVGSRQVAEDITGEVFLRAVRNIGRVQWQGRDIGAWLMTISKNLVVDYLTSPRRRLETHHAPVLDSVDGWEALDRCMGERIDDDPASDPAEATVAYLSNVALLTAVKGLSDEQREVLVLRFLRGLSVKETAAEMGRNVGAVKAMQYRATQRLAHNEQLRALVAA